MARPRGSAPPPGRVESDAALLEGFDHAADLVEQMTRLCAGLKVGVSLGRSGVEGLIARQREACDHAIESGEKILDLLESSRREGLERERLQAELE